MDGLIPLRVFVFASIDPRLNQFAVSFKALNGFSY